MVRAAHYLPPTATHRAIRLVPRVRVRRRRTHTQELWAVDSRPDARERIWPTPTGPRPSCLAAVV